MLGYGCWVMGYRSLVTGWYLFMSYLVFQQGIKPGTKFPDTGRWQIFGLAVKLMQAAGQSIPVLKSRHGFS